MIHKEPLASYLKSRAFLGALGLAEGEPVVFSLLGQLRSPDVPLSQACQL